MQKLISVLVFWTLLVFQVLGQNPVCTNFNEPAPLADSCSNAVFLCGNYLEGYCSSTTGLSDDTLGALTFNQGGFLRLSPCSDTLILSIEARNCSDTNGLRVQLFSGTCDTLVLESAYQVPNDSTVALFFEGLVPDGVYFLALDGTVCEFTIQVLQGMGTAAPGADGTWSCTDGSIDGPTVLCPSDIATYSIIPPDCTFTPGAPVGGDTIYCPPPPDIACGDSDSLQFIWHIPESTMFLGDSTGTTIQIIVNPDLSLIDTIIQDSVWVEWQLIPPSNPGDTLVYCDCQGGIGGGSIAPLPVTIKHEFQYEYCVLTCYEPSCFINGEEYFTPGQYIQQPDNCTTIIVIIEEDFYIPFVDLGPDRTICAGESIDLSLNISQPFYIYTWSNGDTGPAITVQPTSTTTYFVLVEDPFNGCITQDDITVTVLPVVLNDLGLVATLNCDVPCVDIFGEAFCQAGTYSRETDQCETTIFTIDFEKIPQNLGVVDTLTCANPCFDFLGQSYCDPGTYSAEDDCYIYQFTLVQDTMAPQISAVVHDCLPSNAMFTVGFNVQGQAPFKVNGNTISGSYFLSSPMANGTNYAFVVEQAGNGCGAVVASTFDCAQFCSNDPGAMVASPQNGCVDQTLYAAVASPATVTPGDTVLFILHTLPGTDIGTVLATNNTGAFDYNSASMTPGQVYYVSQVVGPTLPGGAIDLSNACTSISVGQALSFSALPQVETMQAQDPSCAGMSDGSLNLLQVMGTAPINYALGSGGFSSNTTFENLPSGTYPLQIIDANGCASDTLITLNEPDVLSLNIGTTQTLLIGESLVLQVETNASTPINAYWSSSTGQTQDGGQEWEVQPTIPTVFSCEIIDTNGCTAQAEVLIQVDGAMVYYPNVVLENANNPDNEYFTLFAPEGYVNSIKSLEIYNRWGGQVFNRQDFQPNDPLQGWRGVAADGKACPQDVYVFVARVELFDGEEQVLSGDITLIR